MTKLKTLKDFQVNPKSWASAMSNAGRKYTTDIDDFRQEAINDLIDIYELEKILNIKLNDKTCSILTKYIMWKFDIKKNDKKLY